MGKKNDQNAKNKKKRLNYKIIIAAVVVGLCVFWISSTSSDPENSILNNPLHNSLYDTLKTIDFDISDIMFQPDGNVILPIIVVGVDEESVYKYGQYQFWERDLYAKALDRIHSLCDPSVVAFDVLFSGTKDPVKDQMLVDACKKYGDVVTGVYFEYERKNISLEVGSHYDYSIPTIGVFPFDALRNVTKIGNTDNGLQSNGFARTLSPNIEYNRSYVENKGMIDSEDVLSVYTNNDASIESLALVSYKAYCEKTGDPYDSTELYALREKYGDIYFTYSTGPREGNTPPFETISISTLLDESDPCTILANRGILQDSPIILIGCTYAGVDDFYTPGNHRTKMSGVYVHANSIEAIAQNKIQVNANNTLVSIIYSIIAAAFVIFVYLVLLKFAGIAAAGIIGVDLIVSAILYHNGIYLKTFFLILPIILTLIAAIILHYLSARAAKEKINNAFKMYVAPEIVDELASSGDFELKLGGQTKDIAVLFIDIRGFTTMSEKLEPEEVVSILNEYFELVTDAIFKNKGTLDKFVGDAAMAVYNSPNDLDDYVYRAVHTGWDILLGTQDLLTKLEETHHRTIGFGIGVNCGPATIGNIGSSFRMDFTAIGDTVNTSARLEANAKAGQILISQDVLDRISDWVEVEKVEGIKLKGKSNEFNIYNVTKLIDKPGYLESGISVRKK